MNIDSDDWQVDGSLVYKLFTTEDGARVNQFTIQISSNIELGINETLELAQTVARHLNRSVTPL